MRSRSLPCWLIAALAALPMLTHAQSPGDFPAYAGGWLAYQAGRFKEAGQAWQALATSVPLQAGADELQRAAFAGVLATLAFERAGDTTAYAAWGQAIRYYLASGTAWEGRRSALASQLRAVQAEVSGSASGQSVSGLPPYFGMLEKLSTEGGLFSYNGPTGMARLAAPPDTIAVGVGYLGGTGKQAGAGQSESGSRYASLLPQSSETGGAARLASIGGLEVKREPSAGGASIAGPSDTSVARTGSVADAALYPRTTSRDEAAALEPPDDAPAQPLQPLPLADAALARQAWGYFETNRQSATGLVDGRQDYPYTTTGDMAGALAALVAANELHLLDPAAFRERMHLFLKTLRDLPRYAGELPNREYDARDGTLVDLANRPSATGSGYNIFDIGRLLIWLDIARLYYPDMADEARAVSANWQFGRATGLGHLHSVIADARGETLFIDEQLGYQQYAAVGFASAGLLLDSALRYDDARIGQVDGVRVWYDSRSGALPTSEPFLLGQLELGGIDPCFQSAARSLHDAQMAHARRLGRPVALSEELLDRSPWFAFSTVYADATPWKVASYDRRSQPALRNFSTKAAYAWAILYPDGYAPALRVKVQKFAGPGGIAAGEYESGDPNRTIGIATNAMILETAWYAARGARPFARFSVPGRVVCPRQDRIG